jgi:hypothetical protein
MYHVLKAFPYLSTIGSPVSSNRHNSKVILKWKRTLPNSDRGRFSPITSSEDPDA